MPGGAGPPVRTLQAMVAGRHRSARWPLLGFGFGVGAVAAAVIAVALGIGQVTGNQACAAVLNPAGAVSGIATHYVLQSVGNCSYPDPPANQLFVALSPPEYDSAAACGSYLEVHGPDGSVTVEVIDQCPPCAQGHIDLSEPAFAALAPLSAGLIDVSYQTIADPPLPAPVSFEVKDGSSQYWLALLVINTGNAVASVQLETAPGAWLDLSRASYNYWIDAAGAGPGPFTVRVTDTLGHQVTVHGIALDPGAVQDSGVYMYGAGGAAPPPASAAPAPSSAAPSSAGPPARRPRTSASPARPPAAARFAPIPSPPDPVPASPSPGPSC